MAEFNRSVNEGEVLSLLERRNKKINSGLVDFNKEILVTKKSIIKKLDEFLFLLKLPGLKDHNIGENVVDLDIYKENIKILKENYDWGVGSTNTNKLVYDFICDIRDAFLKLYEVDFRSAMLVSRGLSELELDTKHDFYSQTGFDFSAVDLSQNKVEFSVETFIPKVIGFLENLQFNIFNLQQKIKIKGQDVENITDELCALRNQLQSGLQYVQGYVSQFEKNNKQ